MKDKKQRYLNRHNEVESIKRLTTSECVRFFLQKLAESLQG